MKSLFIVLVIAIAFAQVTKLDKDNFDKVVDGSNNVFVKFFAPWCGHCKRLAPDYITVAEHFANTKGVIIAEVDCDANSDLCSKYGVQGFPTLKLFKKGSTTPLDYEGGRSVEELKSYIIEKTGKKAASAVVSLTDATFDKVVMDETKHVIVKMFAPWCGHCKALAPKYETVAGLYAGETDLIVAEIDCTANKEVCTKYEVHGYPTLKVFPKDNKKGIDYNGGREVTDFAKYFNEHFGYNRDENGKLNEKAGRIEEADKLAEGFIGASNKEERIAKVQGIAGADYYLKVMNKIVKKGGDFVEKEIKRLSNMLESTSVKAEKIADFQKRINVLKAFN